MPGCVITLPKTVSKRLDLSFCIFARRGEKYSCYVETEQYMWIGFLNPTFQPFPNFRNVWTSAFLSDTSIRPTSKPKNPCGSDSRIRHFNHSRIFAMCGHRLFCRIQVSNLRRNRKIHVGRILESDISIISEFSQYMDIGFSCRIQVSNLRQNPAQRRGLLFKRELAARSRQVFSLNTVSCSSGTFPTFDTAVNQRCAVKVFSYHRSV